MKKTAAAVILSLFAATACAETVMAYIKDDVHVVLTGTKSKACDSDERVAFAIKGSLLRDAGCWALYGDKHVVVFYDECKCTVKYDSESFRPVEIGDRSKNSDRESDRVKSFIHTGYLY